jgi:hypothetical protein
MKLKPAISLRRALSDPQLLGNVLPGESWRPWRVLLIAAMGEPLLGDERALFKKLTGREREPLQRVEELAAVVGRRGGKSRAMATLAVYIAGLCQHDLARGEKGVLLLIAPDQRQASIALGYAEAAFDGSTMLRQLVTNRTTDAIELVSGVSLEVRSASFRRLRGPTYVGIIVDEGAFLYSEEFSANADTEILNACRPGLATTGGPLIIASSPYAKRGVLFDVHKRHYGAGGDPLILVAQGASRVFNQSLPQAVVDRAMQRDPASASAEYLAQFRSDIESFVSRETVEACLAHGVRERAPVSGIKYSAFCDPSGGSSDSMTLGVAHREGDVAILDALREVRPPFSPESVVVEFATLLRSYRVGSAQGDHYGGEWPRERFREAGITYEPCKAAKSELYKNCLSALNSRRVELLDNDRLVAQLVSLERKVGRSGRDVIDHPPNQHDDVCNAACGVLSGLVCAPAFCSYRDWVGGDDEPPNQPRSIFEHPALRGF